METKQQQGSITDIDALMVRKKSETINSKFNINLLSLFASSSSVSKSPNCGINSNCHGSSSTCCNRH